MKLKNALFAGFITVDVIAVLFCAFMIGSYSGEARGYDKGVTAKEQMNNHISFLATERGEYKDKFEACYETMRAATEKRSVDAAGPVKTKKPAVILSDY